MRTSTIQKTCHLLDQLQRKYHSSLIHFHFLPPITVVTAITLLALGIGLFIIVRESLYSLRLTSTFTHILQHSNLYLASQAPLNVLSPHLPPIVDLSLILPLNTSHLIVILCDRVS